MSDKLPLHKLVVYIAVHICTRGSNYIQNRDKLKSKYLHFINADFWEEGGGCLDFMKLSWNIVDIKLLFDNKHLCNDFDIVILWI